MKCFLGMRCLRWLTFPLHSVFFFASLIYSLFHLNSRLQRTISTSPVANSHGHRLAAVFKKIFRRSILNALNECLVSHRFPRGQVQSYPRRHHVHLHTGDTTSHIFGATHNQGTDDLLHLRSILI